MKCVDARTGRVAWTHDGDGLKGKGQLIAAGDRLVVLTMSGKLLIVRAAPARFRLLAHANVFQERSFTPPALANGSLYMRSSTGRVICFDVGSSAEPDGRGTTHR